MTLNQTRALPPKPDPHPHPNPNPAPNSDPDPDPDPCPVAKQVVELMADGRTRVRLDSGEEHRYRPNSMLKFSAARE